MDLDKISSQQEQQMLNTFNAIIQAIKNQAILNEITRALEVGNVDAVIELLGLDEDTWSPLAESIREAYKTGGITGAVQIGPIPVSAGTITPVFNIRNIRAEEWIAAQSSNLITEIVESQRQVVRDELQAGLERGDNPRTTALNLVGRIDPATKNREGGVIGLTEQQAGWSRSARTELENLDSAYFSRSLRDKRLDTKIRRAIESGTPLDRKTIDAAVLRMQQRTLKYRGDVIARTESINALRAGQYESVLQAIAKGKLNINDVVKKWDATMDGRTRHTHAQAERNYTDGIRIDQPFQIAKKLGGFDLMQYPGDNSGSAENVIQCRCRLVTEIDFGAKLRRVEGFR